MQHDHHRVPVTALACWGRKVILAGSGSCLLAYNTADHTLLKSISIFEGQAIHGIVTPDHGDDGLVIVWGGQLLRALRLRSNQHGSQLDYEAGPIGRVDDWILDAMISPPSAYRVAIVTAHNALSIATAHKESMSLDIREAVPGSNCILYCAQVTWLSPSSCLIASGTAFGDIIVWSCQIAEQEARLEAAHQIHYSFPAHDGSVFGVQVLNSGLADAKGEPQRILASCSDDRSIRLWDISDLSLQTETNHADLRETGFGSVQSSSAIKPTCLASAMGHISRIWHVRFVRAGSGIRLLSFGEDATCITWSLSRSEGSIAMQQIKVEKAHNGKNIWAVAIRTRSEPDDDIAQTGSVLTGGADGSVSIRDVDVNVHENPLDWKEQQCATTTARYRSYGFVAPRDVVAITDNGEVVSLKLDATKSTVRSIQLGPPASQLRGYSIMAALHGAVFFAGRGEVYYHLAGSSGYQVLVDVGEKVAGLFAHHGNAIQTSTETTARRALLVTTVRSKSAYWHDCRAAANSRLEITSSRALALPEGFVVTSFTEFTQDDRTFVTLGSRSGCIALYNLPPQNEDSGPIPHVGEFPAVHGIEAVTALRYLMGMLLTTGRDGSFAAHKLDISRLQHPSNGDRGISLTTVHQLALPLGPNVEDFAIIHADSIWIWGFRGKHFVVFDLTAQQEIMVVECGGAHRNFAFDPDTYGGTFIWTKTSELYFQHQNRLTSSSLHAGGHGREIKASAISPIDPELVATGAEDTDIKFQLHVNGTWCCLHTLQKHITGIQHLQWSSDGNYLFSSGGVEEFYVWKVTHNLPAVRIGVACESAHPQCNLSDLRIMNFEAKARDSGYEIMMVYSNSNLQKWHYCDKTWTLSGSGDYLTSCLTQCLRLSMVSSNSENASTIQRPSSQLFTASTDGHLVQWDRDDSEHRDMTWQTRHKVHQSAVLSLIPVDLSSSAGDNFLLISGGDDNALGLTRVTFNSQSSTPTMTTLLVPHAHAAAITALTIVRVVEDKIWLLSASIDQRIKLWKVNIKDGLGVDGIDITLVKNVQSAVADTSSMELVGQNRVLICGVGMDMWKIDLDSL
ncbi:hypothetical protein CBER1_11039 [Cercospora berteroae]|uniref:Uncharacterized protein n=1 Tax=Cercospora berteroae TaxID=357750 RepID=A0A2S6BYR5_9PEZI|nr:hypothetical protein CBER1_11039 [Cercospora berteroae]